MIATLVIHSQTTKTVSGLLVHGRPGSPLDERDDRRSDPLRAQRRNEGPGARRYAQRRPRRAYEREAHRQPTDTMRDAANVSVLATPDCVPERCARCAETTCATRPCSCSAPTAPTAPPSPPIPAPTPGAPARPDWPPTFGHGAWPRGVPPGARPSSPATTPGRGPRRIGRNGARASGPRRAGRPDWTRSRGPTTWPLLRLAAAAEGRTIHDVAAQLGHSPALTLSTYGHVLAQFAEAERIYAETEIAKARGEACSLRVPFDASRKAAGHRARRPVRDTRPARTAVPAARAAPKSLASTPT